MHELNERIVSADNKQLMSIIYRSMTSYVSIHTHTDTNKIAGDHVPTEIHRDVIIPREDIATSHVEADNIVKKSIISAKEHPGTTMVVSDDTDVSDGHELPDSAKVAKRHQGHCARAPRYHTMLLRVGITKRCARTIKA